jgi:hypothetical protein
MDDETMHAKFRALGAFAASLIALDVWEHGAATAFDKEYAAKRWFYLMSIISDIFPEGPSAIIDMFSNASEIEREAIEELRIMVQGTTVKKLGSTGEHVYNYSVN